MTQRRLAIFDVNGELLYPAATRDLLLGNQRPEHPAPAVIDVSDIPNDNAAAPFELVVQELCDHQQWHVVARVAVPCWSDDAWQQKG